MGVLKEKRCKSIDDYKKTIDKTNVFIGNPIYKSDVCIETHKQAFFQILSQR